MIAGTIPELFGDRVAASPRALAYEQEREGVLERVTWAELRSRVDALAGALVELGLMPGDRVAVVGQTTGEWATADLAIGVRRT